MLVRPLISLVFEVWNYSFFRKTNRPPFFEIGRSDGNFPRNLHISFVFSFQMVSICLLIFVAKGAGVECERPIHLLSSAVEITRSKRSHFSMYSLWPEIIKRPAVEQRSLLVFSLFLLDSSTSLKWFVWTKRINSRLKTLPKHKDDSRYKSLLGETFARPTRRLTIYPEGVPGTSLFN